MTEDLYSALRVKGILHCSYEELKRIVEKEYLHFPKPVSSGSDVSKWKFDKESVDAWNKTTLKQMGEALSYFFENR